MGTHSISSSKNYQRSPNYWWFHDKLRRIPKRPVAVMRAGTIMHLFFELLLKGLPLDAALTQTRKEVQSAAQQWIAGNWPSEAEKLQKEWAILEALLPHWAPRFPFEIIDTEVIMRAPLGNHTLIGTVDTLVRSGNANGEMEHKSLSGSTPMNVYIEAMSTDIQRYGYWYLAEHNGIENWFGCYANIVRKLSLWSRTNCKECKGDGKTVEIYEEADAPNIVSDCPRCGGKGKEKLNEPHQAFVQELLPLNRSLRDEAMKGVALLMDEMDAMEAPRLPCPDMCRRGEFSNRLCPYYKVCIGEESIDNDLIYQTVEPRYVDVAAKG